MSRRRGRTETLYRGEAGPLVDRQTHATENITFATPLDMGKNMMQELNNKIHVLNIYKLDIFNLKVVMDTYLFFYQLTTLLVTFEVTSSNRAPWNNASGMVTQTYLYFLLD